MVDGTVTLKYWYGGVFSFNGNGELVYMGGKGKTFSLDLDELCWWWLEDFAKKCGDRQEVHGIYYLVPGLSLSGGLRKVYSDAEVLDLSKLAVEYRCIELYVLEGVEPPLLKPLTQAQSHPLDQVVDSSNRQKLPTKRAPPKPLISTVQNESSFPKDSHTFSTTTTCVNTVPQNIFPHTVLKTLLSPKEKTNPSSQKPDSQIQVEVSSIPPQLPCDHTVQTNPVPPDYDWEDPRPESPVNLNDLLGIYSSDDELDPLYNPLVDKGQGVVREESDDDSYEDEDGLTGGEQLEVNEEGGWYSDASDDEECRLARNKVREFNSKLVELALKLQKDAEHGKLGISNEDVVRSKPVEGVHEHVSDYECSDEDVHTPTGSDEEGASLGKKRSQLVSRDTDFSQFKWQVGMRFANREDFKDAVAKYGILQGRNVYISDSNSKRNKRTGISCVEGCPFYLYASWESRRATFSVKRVVDEHTCHRNMQKNRQLKATWVAKQFLEVFKARPHWPAREIIETIKRAFKIVVKRDFAYTVKYNAHRLLHGSMHEHYRKVGNYIAALKNNNPGAMVELVTDESKQPPVFRRLFTCFEGLQQGWKEGCRKVICVDACFLKTFLGGQLLSAVGRDGNDQMFPIAWSVAEGENNLSWEWFFKQLKVCLDLGDGEGICIISDEHQSILNAVAAVLPKAEHRHCARHVFSHWHKAYRGDEFKLQFWKIAKCYNIADYTVALEELRQISGDVAAAFEAHNPQVFCRAYLSTTFKCDAITSNMAETFNGYIINARTKHLLYMLEDIRIALMQRLVVKRQEMQKATTILCPKIQVKLEKEKEKAANCDVTPSSDTLFNVSYFVDMLVVNLSSRTCTCRKWDMLGIPCCHAVACIFFLNKEAEDYVDEKYRRDVYLKAYAGSIPPCEGERHWPKVGLELDPPPIKIGPGRPRRNRIKDPFEDPKKKGVLSRNGMEMTCSLCQVKGHNKRKCPQKDNAPTAPVPPPAKRGRGRPRKDGQPPIPRGNSITPQQSKVGSSSSPLNVTSGSIAQVSTEHHSATAHPTQLGRGGRMIRGGRGSRGGRSSAAGGRGSTARGRGVTRGRGSRNQIPLGVGVYMAPDGNAYSNTPTGRGTPIQLTQSSQTSTLQ